MAVVVGAAINVVERWVGLEFSRLRGFLSVFLFKNGSARATYFMRINID